MFLMQGQAAQEANAFKNLEKGEEREILDRQNTKLVEQFKLQSIKDGQKRILADQNKKTVQKKVYFTLILDIIQQVVQRAGVAQQQSRLGASTIGPSEQGHEVSRNPYILGKAQLKYD